MSDEQNSCGKIRNLSEIMDALEAESAWGGTFAALAAEAAYWLRSMIYDPRSILDRTADCDGPCQDCGPVCPRLADQDTEERMLAVGGLP